MIDPSNISGTDASLPDEKSRKVKAIEATLAEMGMSKQELIDLIQDLLSQSVSEERVEEISVEEVSLLICEGNTEIVTKFLSLEELEKLQIKLGLAHALKRAEDLGIVIDHKKLSMMLQMENISKIMLNNTVVANGKPQVIEAAKAAKLAAQVDNDIGASLAQNINRGQDKNQQKQQTSLITRVIGALKIQVQDITNSISSPVVASGNAAAQQQQQQIQQMQRNIKVVESANRSLKRQESKMKKLHPEFGSVKTRGREMFGTIRTKGGEKEVNIKDYLNANGRLTPKAMKILDAAASAGGALELSLNQLSKGLPTAKSFNFDASGRLQVAAKTEKDLSFVNVQDYIHDLKRDAESALKRAETKKTELEAKKNNAEGAMRQRDISRGPELDSSNMIKSAEQLRDPALKYYLQSLNQGHNIEGGEKPKEVKESKRTADELVKQDIIADKAKMIKEMKGEIDGVKSSMKEVMKDMKEAEQNKDLVDEMRKNMQSNKPKGL